MEGFIKMICPYIQNTNINIQRNIVNKETGHTEYYVIGNYWGNMECPKEGCAVWKDGKCRYNQ